MEILVGENGPPNRPNLNSIRKLTPNLKVPKPRIKRDTETLKILQGMIASPFLIN